MYSILASVNVILGSALISTRAYEGILIAAYRFCAPNSFLIHLQGATLTRLSEEGEQLPAIDPQLLLE